MPAATTASRRRGSHPANMPSRSGRSVTKLRDQSAATADISLQPTKKLVNQLSNAEWLASFPGTDDQKKATLGCISCHDLDRIVRSQHTADEFMQIFERMSGYYPGS